MFLLKNRKTKRGFTLIEALVFLFIFSLIVITFYRVYSIGIQYIINSKNRLAATALANEKMEIVRNLAFDDIAHTTGDPVGNLNAEEDLTRGGIAFHVITQIKNEDDPLDGTLGGNPNDANYIDYKYVKITVSWSGGRYSVSLSSRFVPPGIEQPVVGKGVLVINVSSDKAGGAMVPQSTVRVRNSDIGFDETHSTNEYGSLMLVGISRAIKKYEITVTKNGYESVSTMSAYPGTAYNPTHEHASVVSDAVNTIDIYQNELSDLIFKTKDYLGNSVADIDFHLRGGKKIGSGYDLPNDPIYNTDGDYATNGSGEKSFSEISPGQYEMTLKEAGYSIIGLSKIMPFSLVPGESAEVDIKVSPSDMTSLLVRVTRAEDTKPLTNATVQLTRNPDYDVSIVTTDDGMAFFPNAENPPFEDGGYDIKVTADGYQEYSGSVSIVADQIKEENISMLNQ